VESAAADAGTMGEMTDPRRKGRLTLIFLALVFLGPMAVAVLLYLTDFRWRPSGTLEHGIIYQPARPMADESIAIVGADGGSATLRGKWTLLYLGPGDCKAPCRQALADMRQVRRALGRDRDRVQRLYVVTLGTADTEFLAKEHAGIGLIADARAAHAVEKEIGERWSGDIFLADPFANLVMRYPAGTPIKDIHEDLKRLLTVSSIG
jgi:hypothetical protein